MCWKNAGRPGSEARENAFHEFRITLIRYGYNPDDSDKPWESRALKEFDWCNSYRWMLDKSENPAILIPITLEN